MVSKYLQIAKITEELTSSNNKPIKKTQSKPIVRSSLFSVFPQERTTYELPKASRGSA
ncbi:hypothetical protein AVEN_200869-1, partial [Araneus ventricosus]